MQIPCVRSNKRDIYLYILTVGKKMHVSMPPYNLIIKPMLENNKNYILKLYLII